MIILKRVIVASTLVVIAATAAGRDIIVRRPTIVAFFPPVTTDQIERDSDTNDALDDFQWYARLARPPLKKAGVDFFEIYARSFRLRLGNRRVTFRPKTAEVGYYFVAPGKQPRIEYGVATDTDLFRIAHESFGVEIEGAARQP